jgi:hypothetical protein
MHNESFQKPEDPRQTPWNKGKLIDSKPPLRTKDVWDVVSLKVEDVAPHGITVERPTVRQRKPDVPSDRN